MSLFPSRVAVESASLLSSSFLRNATCWFGAIAAAAFVPAVIASAQSTPAAVERAQTAYPGGFWQPPSPKFGSTIVENVAVKMDDGVTLQARVAFPTDPMTGKRAAGNFPVVIEHTPYGMNGRSTDPNTYLTEHGYIYAVVRARGTGASEGELSYFGPRDGQDGANIVKWAASDLDGTDGRVALVGCSWPGGLALTNAAYIGPNSPVKAVIASCVGLTGLHRQTLTVSGIPTTRGMTFVSGLLNAVGNTPAAKRAMGGLLDEILAGGDPAYDREYWRERRPITHAQKIVDNGIPVLLWTGWNDYVDTGAIRTYLGLQNAFAKRPLDAPMTANQAVSSRYQIIVSGVGHSQGLNSAVYLQWLETWVKGVDTGFQATNAPMHVYEAGTGRWSNIIGYPLTDSYSAWKLAPEGELKLTEKAGSSTLSIGWGDPAKDGNKLTFTTAPLDSGATLGGPISATIYASSTNRNIMLIGKLFDVAPDGTAVEITRGAILGSQRALDKAKTWRDAAGIAIWPWQTLTGDDFLVPEKVYKLDMLLSPRQWGVQPDHRLRFEITTQSPVDICPVEGVPPQSGTDVCGLTAPQRATVPGGVYTIRLGGNTPSTLNLPQLPYKAIPEVRAGVMPSGWNIASPEYRNTPLPLDWATK